MKIPVVYNNKNYNGYFYDSDTKKIIGRQGRPLKTLQHKTYSQITLIYKCVPENLNYEKLINSMEHQHNNYEKL